jgi:hypothetical protein
MNTVLDFELAPANGVSNRHCCRGAVFALRILLNHPEIRTVFMDDCESLLRLLGKHAVWPKEVNLAVCNALKASDDEESSVTTEIDTTDFSLASLLKGRHAWNLYENTISRFYSRNPKLITCALEENLARLKPKAILKTPGNQNTLLLAKLLGLDPVECRLFDFAEMRAYDLFQGFLRCIRELAPNDGYRLVASAIDTPVPAVRAALRASASLRSYGLVRLDSTPTDLEDFLRVDDSGETFLTEDFASPEDMLRTILHPSQAPSLTSQDYLHLEKEFSWLVNYLKNVASGRVKSANILLYGPPGTGKSEFARLLVQHAGLTAFDVKSSDDDGDPVPGKTRLNHFALSQRFLSEREKSLIIFDEIEDVFPDTGFSLAALFGNGSASSRSNQPKAWLNNQLEHSPVPAIWISNSIGAIDEAFLRRFAFHVEFRTPPKLARERVIKRCLENAAVSDKLITSLAVDDSLSPAQINQACRFALLCNSAPGGIDETVLLQVLTAGNQSQPGGDGPQPPDPQPACQCRSLQFFLPQPR